MSTPFQRIAIGRPNGHVSLMLAEQIRANMIRLREAKGWSRRCLAEKVAPQTSSQQIERLEKGQRSLDPDWIERIARALGVQPDELITGNDKRFDLIPQVADAIAENLARFVLRGDEPDQEIVQGLSILLQEMSATFSRTPEARLDPLAARLAVDLLARQHGPRAS